MATAKARRPRAFTLRDDGALFDLLDARRTVEAGRGRRMSRTALVREILHASLRVLRQPVRR